jgi:hypothetical protein
LIMFYAMIFGRPYVLNWKWNVCVFFRFAFQWWHWSSVQSSTTPLWSRRLSLPYKRGPVCLEAIPVHQKQTPFPPHTQPPPVHVFHIK